MDTFTLIRLVGVIVVLGAALVALLLPLALVLAFREYRARVIEREARRARAVEREGLSATQASCGDPPGLLRLPDGSYYGPDGVIYGEIPY